jgi:ubiquinol oxidase
MLTGCPAGDQLWIDRFMAQHAAIVYYIILVLLFVFSPKLAYNFSELIEAHAVDTYGESIPQGAHVEHSCLCV